MPTTEFFQAAKIRNLSAQEARAILHYAQELDIDPLRALVNKELFLKIEEAAKRVPNFDEQLFESIKEKLEFTFNIAQPVYSTKELRKGQKAKFFFEDKKFVPIKLQTNFDEYGLWKVELHRDMQQLQAGTTGEVLFEQKALIAYKFPTTILEALEYEDEHLIKIPHSDRLKILARRKYPRVETNFIGVVRKVGTLRDHPFYRCKICNLSEGGVKICLEPGIFNIKDRVIVRFKIGTQDIEVESSIESEITYNKEGEYGVKFLKLSDKVKFIIKQYVMSHLQEEEYA